MNLAARVQKLEASRGGGSPLTIWADGKTPQQISEEIERRTEGDSRRRILLVGWETTPEQRAVLPGNSVSIATGVPRATPGNC